jgi:hypothetical protein
MFDAEANMKKKKKTFDLFFEELFHSIARSSTAREREMPTARTLTHSDTN